MTIPNWETPKLPQPVTRPQPAFASVSLSGQADEPTRAEPTVQQATQVESSPLMSRRRRRDEMDDATTARIRPWQVPRLVEPEPTRPVYRPPPVYVRPPPRFHETGDRAFPWEPSPRAPPGPPPASWIRELTRRGTKRLPETTPDTTPSKKSVQKRTLMDSGAGPSKRREVGQVTSGLKRSADDDLDEIRRGKRPIVDLDET